MVIPKIKAVGKRETTMVIIALPTLLGKKLLI
jgi:hypothetical protein